MDWRSVELGKAEADKFRQYLKGNGLVYEASGADNLVHFEVYTDEATAHEVNGFLKSL